MPATDSKQESRREVAERIVGDHDCRGRSVSFQLRRVQLTNAIEAALEIRDEKWAEILEAGSDGVGGDWGCDEAAAAIRHGDTNA